MVPFTLYTLQYEKDGGEMVISPFVWITKVELAYLKVPHDVRSLSLYEVHHDLSKSTGNENVTVPTIQLANGEFITDSLKIAEYLEETYAKPAGKSLFLDSEEGKELGKTLPLWVMGPGWSSMQPLLMPTIWYGYDEPSREYYRSVYTSRFGTDPSEIDEWHARRSDTAWVDEKVAGVLRALKPMDDRLKANYEAKAAPPGELWLGGKSFSHADAGIYGIYRWNSLDAILKEKVWDKGDLKYLQMWRDGMDKLFGSEV